MASGTRDGSSPAMKPSTNDLQAPAATLNHVADEPQSRSRGRWRMTAILAALLLCLFLSALEATIVATALPTITQDLRSAAGYTWIGGAYLLANAASGPIWAKLSDIWGRKPIILLDLASFFAASAICATATTMRVLIAARVLQGAAGGGLILLVHICISDLFSVRERSLFLGLTEFVWALAGGIGPILGGVFASLLSWRWCFYINLPICGIAIALILVFLDIKHESTSFKEGVKALDWLGIITFLGFTVMLMLGLDFGGAVFAWSSAKVVSLIVIGGLMIFAFVYTQARVSKYPIMPVKIFKQRTTVASHLVAFFQGFVMIAAEYYMPLFFQSVLGAGPLLSGLLLLPLVILMAAAGITAGFVMHRTGRFCELIWVGTVLLCLGAGLLIHFGVGTSIAHVVIFQMIIGAGAGLLFEPPIIAVQSQVKQEDVATATSTLSFARNIAFTISIVVGAVVFQNSMDAQSHKLRQAGLTEVVVEQFSGKNAEANVALIKSIAANATQELAIKQAFAWSIRNMWIMYTVFAVFAVIAGLFIDKTHLAAEHTETITGIRKPKASDTDIALQSPQSGSQDVD